MFVMCQHAVSIFDPRQLKCMLVQSTNLAIALSQQVQLPLHQGNKWNRATNRKQNSNTSLTTLVKSIKSRLLNGLLHFGSTVTYLSVQIDNNGNSHSSKYRWCQQSISKLEHHSTDKVIIRKILNFSDAFGDISLVLTSPQ